MSWTYDENNRDPEFLRRFVAFLQSCITQRGNGRPIRPEFVPCEIEITETVQSEAPMIFPGRVYPGIYRCEANQWGAISVKLGSGKLMGIRPSECIVLAMTENPHFQREAT